jgi:hypothetical protein
MFAFRRRATARRLILLISHLEKDSFVLVYRTLGLLAVIFLQLLIEPSLRFPVIRSYNSNWA